MIILLLLKDRSKKKKEKTEAISMGLINGSIKTDELISVAGSSNDTDKATCIEAIEYATKQTPEIANESVFDFVTLMLNEKAPRVKWESAKVIGNTAHLFPGKLKKPIAGLLKNAGDEGTFVRWAAAFALGEILKINTPNNNTLVPLIEAISAKETNAGVNKKYLAALKKIGKSNKSAR